MGQKFYIPINASVLCGGVWCFYLHFRFHTERSFLACTGLNAVIKSASVDRWSSHVSTPIDRKCSSRMFLFTAWSSGRTSIMVTSRKVHSESIIFALKKKMPPSNRTEKNIQYIHLTEQGHVSGSTYINFKLFTLKSKWALVGLYFATILRFSGMTWYPSTMYHTKG